MSPFENIREESAKVRREARERTIGYILGALGLVAGLAWNDAIKAFIDSIYPADGNGGITAKFIYAVVITVFVVVISVYLTRLAAKDKGQE